MATQATNEMSGTRDELIVRERAYLQAVQAADGRAAAGLTAPETLLVSGRGPMRLRPDDIRRMLEEDQDGRTYEFVEDGAEVLEVTDDVAIISYKLITHDGDRQSAAFDTDVWVKHDGDWRCTLHAEVPADEGSA